ncbi:hypothetical protein [Oceanobacillus sp. FSL H7-0719]|uniref:hypothetical protein n=1 Tax=Oceanobacillus sp. FSL H7-0719 TaxID=2954507 RepID=UPI003245D55C
MKQIRIVKKNAARMLTMMNLLVSILFAMIYDVMIQNGLGEKSTFGSAMGIMIIFILFPAIYFTWKMYHDLKQSST